MGEALLARLLPLAALLLLSAYFSASEAAFFSLSKVEQDTLRRRGGARLTWMLERMASSPDDVLITVLTGNMLVNVFASSLGEAVGRLIFPVEAELLSIVTMTGLLLVTGEMAPKSIAVRYAPAFARFSAVPLYTLYRGLRPVRWFLRLFSRLAGRQPAARPAGRLGERAAAGARRPGIIRSAVRIGFKEGILDNSELHLVESFWTPGADRSCCTRRREARWSRPSSRTWTTSWATSRCATCCRSASPWSPSGAPRSWFAPA